eukprot:CAMPEP_0172550522 /NCGR_PEP_ID=MMETSP1067-20121228/30026_1 /TAXON_ID=265564 ORGANISM="Thalassiosira punctigera, Strain Tpunct2005C2" /NCGR_SAMPLE_ID=MMETSP1067 /ASSEMBLY_ACC=CAM_ASM_000444 /LENGTH=69 /DNA_ID=CAMNT_0013338129 /DNA_START=89 /DNA_END=295 /DNA_ORIENTATION=-
MKVQLFASVALVLLTASNGVLSEEQSSLGGIVKAVAEEVSALDPASKDSPTSVNFEDEEELPELQEDDD